jgi:hypothetical protein
VQVNQNYGTVTAESLAKSQAYWEAARKAIEAKRAAAAAKA